MNSMPLVSTRDAGRRARWVVVGGFALLTIWFAGGFPPFVNPNELSRFEMIYAVVEEGTFQIDDAVRILGDHEDKAVSGGHFYSNKAPGLALAAIPVYRLLRCLHPAPRSGADPIFTVWLPLLTVSLAAVVALERLGVRLAASDSRVAALTLFALAFGTSYVYYSRAFFGHVWAGSLLFLAWDLLQRVEDPTALRRRGWGTFAAGLLGGWAFLSEYTIAPILLCLVLRASATRVWGRLALFVAGIGVPIAILLVYQAICFGSPFTPSYAREAYPAYAELARRRFLGFGLPDPVTLWNFLFHPARGVLLFSPFFAWAAVGFVRWWRSREDRADCLFVFAALGSLLLMLAAYPNWHGGWSLGSRYLVPMFLFVALAIVRALQTPLSRGLFLAAVVFSVANHFLLTLTWPNFPLDVPWPAASGSSWFLARGWIGAHIGPASPAGDAIAVLLALCVLLAGLTVSVRAAQPLTPRPLIGFVVGLVPLVVLLTRPPELGFSSRLWRAAIYGKYSGRDPTREELRRVILSAQTPAERRQAIGVWRSYGPNR
jgi:hypothetical protein